MQDSVKIDKFTWKTNAITIGKENHDLKRMCEENQGRYICMDDSGY